MAWRTLSQGSGSEALELYARAADDVIPEGDRVRLRLTWAAWVPRVGRLTVAKTVEFALAGLDLEGLSVTNTPNLSHLEITWVKGFGFVAVVAALLFLLTAALFSGWLLAQEIGRGPLVILLGVAIAAYLYTQYANSKGRRHVKL